jgi:hypothetical protein
VAENQDVADIVSARFRHLDGIAKTETLIAFRVYSRADIEGIFSTGQQ